MALGRISGFETRVSHLSPATSSPRQQSAVTLNRTLSSRDMSQSPLSSSGSSSPASSRSSPQASHSDTTPSPSGGNKSPLFDPHHLVGKLAFLEASESLAQAAETLALAAKAMSKAAASFAVASGYKDYTHNRASYHYEEGSTNSQAPLQGTESPEWQQNSYALPALMSASEAESLSDVYPRCDSAHEYANGSFLGSVESTSVISSGTNLTDTSRSPLFVNHYDLRPTEYPTPIVQSECQPTTGPIPGVSDLSGTTTDISSVGENLLDEQRAHEHLAEPLGDSDTEPPNQSEILVEPGKEVVAPIIPEDQSDVGVPQRRSQRIVLDSGFDQLPVICVLAKKNPKIICFCKYWGSAPSVISAILKKSVSQPVIHPSGTKLAMLRTVAQEFASLSSGILLWPASKALPDSPSLMILREVHVLHLGEPAKETAECSGSNTTIVITRKELGEMTANARDKFIEEYPLDHDNEAYNQQGPGSWLHLARAHTRVRFCKNPSARGLYLGWLGFQRRDHPGWTAEELVKRANDYAEEFLLRGESTTDGLIGGRIPLTLAEVKSMDLQPAVDAGILAVA